MKRLAVLLLIVALVALPGCSGYGQNGTTNPDGDTNMEDNNGTDTNGTGDTSTTTGDLELFFYA